MQNVKLSGSSRQITGLLLGLSLTAFALVMLGRLVDWRAALHSMHYLRWPWLLVAILALLLNNVAKASRWRQLFPVEQLLPAIGDAFGALMAGQLLNFVLPFRSGDISRAYFMGRHRGNSSAAAAGTIGAEKVLDMMIMGALFTLVLPYFILPAWLESNKNTIWFVSLAALALWIGIIAGLPLALTLLARLARHWPVIARLIGLLSRLLNGFSSLRHRQRLLPILFWTGIAWAASIGATYALLASLSLPASLSLAILANVIVQGGLSVPVAPAGIAIFEWLAILALSIAGIPTEQGLAYGLITHAAVLLFPVIVGIPWLIGRFNTPKNPT
jgi:uncharacterized protein (TIRG00374 family)